MAPSKVAAFGAMGCNHHLICRIARTGSARMGIQIATRAIVIVLSPIWVSLVMTRNRSAITSSVWLHIVTVRIRSCSVAAKITALGSSSRYTEQKNATCY
jgi:hypothetical protein